MRVSAESRVVLAPDWPREPLGRAERHGLGPRSPTWALPTRPGSAAPPGGQLPPLEMPPHAEMPPSLETPRGQAPPRDLAPPEGLPQARPAVRPPWAR